MSGIPRPCCDKATTSSTKSKIPVPPSTSKPSSTSTCPKSTSARSAIQASSSGISGGVRTGRVLTQASSTTRIPAAPAVSRTITTSRLPITSMRSSKPISKSSGPPSTSTKPFKGIPKSSGSRNISTKPSTEISKSSGYGLRTTSKRTSKEIPKSFGYGPRTQVVAVAQSSTGAIPKTTVKTVKTKKVEGTGSKTKVTSTIQKSYKPTRAPSITDASSPGPSKLPPGNVTEDVQQIDVAKDLVTEVSSLEQAVEQQLMEQVTQSPGVAARAKGSKKTEGAVPTITTEDGQTVPATLQITLDRKVERSPEIEYIKRYMTGTKVEEDGIAKKFEYNTQEAEPGPSMPARDDGVRPLHEVIEVKSKISFAPGLIQKISTTVYESTEPDPEEVSHMIEEEAKEIDAISKIPPPEVKGSTSTVFPIKKKLQTMLLNPESVRMLEKSVVLPPVSADEAQEELAPEVMAAIMHTEEKGINLEAAPTNVYNYLFPKENDDLVIQVKPVAPVPMQQVVVPEQIPSELLTEGVPAEIESIAQDAKSCCCRQPTDNLYSSSMLKERPVKVYNKAVKGQPGRKGYPILSEQQPPWNSEDLQPIMDLVGAAPKSQAPPADITDTDLNVTPTFYHNEQENVLEYHLIPQPPRFTSNVQLRGSQKPSWFPGYYMALPENIRCVTSPCGVLPAAWQAVQPDIFAEDSFLIIG
ncbi:hypothetical protein FQR65_LT08078 [Abscondita terminalis]|nr:hypothetical protein FQR65_LT08078 [Abscondita terminalis]